MWLFTPFVIGLFSGFHCIAMCGGLCAVLCPKNTASNLAMTHLGRLCSYSVLGLLFAGVVQGAALQIEGAWLSVLLRSLMGVMLVLAGLTLWMKSKALTITFELPWWTRASRKLSEMQQKNATLAQWYKGLLWGLLPCGLLYGMLLIAATTGSAWQGALFMLFFGLGTVTPLLLSQKLISQWHSKGQHVAAIFIFIIGLWTLLSPWLAHHLLPVNSPWFLTLSLVLERCVP